MSMKFENAQLRVRTIHGRNGVFCVGDLQTALGNFKVKDPILDQFEEGSYEVDAWLDRIYLGQYVAYGRAVSEVRAQLADLQVIEAKRQDLPGEPEPDPIDEEATQPVAAPAPAEPAPGPAQDQPGRDVSAGIKMTHLVGVKVMGWSPQPETASTCQSGDGCPLETERSDRDEDYDNWPRLGEECVLSPRRRRPRQGGAAQAA